MHWAKSIAFAVPLSTAVALWGALEAFASSPMQDAAAVWNMAGANGQAADNVRLIIKGDVRLGVPLEGSARPGGISAHATSSTGRNIHARWTSPSRGNVAWERAALALEQTDRGRHDVPQNVRITLRVKPKSGPPERQRAHIPDRQSAVGLRERLLPQRGPVAALW